MGRGAAQEQAPAGEIRGILEGRVVGADAPYTVRHLPRGNARHVSEVRIPAGELQKLFVQVEALATTASMVQADGTLVTVMKGVASDSDQGRDARPVFVFDGERISS